MWEKVKHYFTMIRLSIKHPGIHDSSTYAKYPREETFRGDKVLNLGCGSSVYPAENVVNLDYLPGDEIDVICDLGKGKLPFKDNEFNLVLANMVLEHVPNWWDCFKEMARVVKPGGMIEVWLPGDGGSSQLGYRDHINIINAFSFGGIDNGMRNMANIWEVEDRKNIGEVKNLKLVSYLTRMKMYWWLQILPQKGKLWMADHLRNVVDEHGFIFIKKEVENG